MQNKFFSDIKGTFGFGCMRFPMNDKKVDVEQTKQMIDRFIKEGFNYFDTAHTYIDGQSEPVLKECLVERYPREAYILTNKLTTYCFEKEEEIVPLFESQLEACGVEYFDFYLLHAQNAELFAKYKRCHAYEHAFAFKKEGRVKHVGISFHDKAEVLEQILIEYPEIEVVQIQFNYLDYEDVGIESRKCYEVCVKYNKPVIVMEPIRGGSLVNLPEEAKQVFDELQGGSYASYALRFAAGFDQMMMVLSGMSTIEQVEDNVSFMKDVVPLDEKELDAVWKVRDIIKAKGSIPCTACKYCMDVCPQNIAIPDLFSDMNAKIIFNNWGSGYYYGIHTKNNGKASDCIKCGKCEKICPQHLSIRNLLEDVAEAFEKKEE